jgi:hypothetical protein
MPTLSPLALLVTTLSQVIQNAQQNGVLLTKNEAATRVALIDPVLRALGWDTANVQMVEPEKTINTTWRADYALHNAANEIELLIEAKSLGSNLEKYSIVQQLLSYAFGFGVLKLLVTDGLNWHFYSDFKPGNTLANNHFNLLRDDAAVCALHLVTWLDAAHFGHGITVSSQSVATAALTPPTTPEVKSAPKHVLKTGLSPKFTSPPKAYHKLAPELAHANNALGKPAWLRLPDGTEHQVKTWKDILIQASNLALQLCPDLSLPLPDKAGKKTALLRWERPAPGLSHTLLSYQGKQAYLYTNYSAAACIANALYLLQLLPKSKAAIEPGLAFATQ